MSLMTGCIKCGMAWNWLSSTTFGSIIIIFSSSGRRVINMLRMIAFMQTDLPVPVAPAMSRCGISARSWTSGRPSLSLPRNSGILLLAIFFAEARITSLRRTTARCSLGISTPTVFLPGIGATMRTLGARRFRATSSARAVTLCRRRPVSRANSNCVTTGPVLMPTTRTLEAEVGEGLFQQGRPLAQHLILIAQVERLGVFQEVQRRQFVVGEALVVGGDDGGRLARAVPASVAAT